MIVQIPCDMLAMCLMKTEKDISLLTEADCKELVGAYLKPILINHPGAIYLNVCYSRSAVPSEVFSTFACDISIDENGYPALDDCGISIKKAVVIPPDIQWGSPYHKVLLTVYNTLLSKGIDLCGIAMKIIKAAAIPLYLSVRASDNHGWEGMGTEFLDKNSLPVNGRPDYSRGCVRNYFHNYIAELLGNYDPDGIEIDWLRAMPVIPSDMLGDYTIINNYMRQLKKTVSAFGKKISVRVFATVQKNLDNGMDVCRWISDGSIDSFTAENFYIPTNFEIPIDEWRQKIAEKNVNDNKYALYCGSDWAVSCGLPFSHYMTPALIRGFASSCTERGADDIYLFNLADCNPETTQMLNEDRGILIDCYESRFAAAAEPDHGIRRYVYLSGCDKRYPITIAPGESKSITIYTGKPASQYRFYLCSTEGNKISILINGNPMSPLEEEPTIPGFEKPQEGEELPVRYYRGQFDSFVRYASAQNQKDIRYGYNTFLITNLDTQVVSISWIEIEVL